MKKIVLKARIINRETLESRHISIRGIDKSSEKYIISSTGGRNSKTKKIRINDVIQEFKTDDIVEITFKKVKGWVKQKD